MWNTLGGWEGRPSRIKDSIPLYLANTDKSKRSLGLSAWDKQFHENRSADGTEGLEQRRKAWASTTSEIKNWDFLFRDEDASGL